MSEEFRALMIKAMADSPSNAIMICTECRKGFKKGDK